MTAGQAAMFRIISEPLNHNMLHCRRHVQHVQYAAVEYYICAFSTNRFLNSAALAYVWLTDFSDECHSRAKKQNRKSTSINNKIGRLRFSLLLYFQFSFNFFLCLHHLLSLT